MDQPSDCSVASTNLYTDTARIETRLRADGTFAVEVFDKRNEDYPSMLIFEGDAETLRAQAVEDERALAKLLGRRARAARVVARYVGRPLPRR